MAFGATQAKVSLALITRFGQAVSFSRYIGSFDAIQSEDNTGGGATHQTWTGRAVRLTNYKGVKFEAMDDGFKQALITGKAIGAIVAAEGLTRAPEPGDVVTLEDDSEWTLIGVTVLSPAGTPIIYNIGATQR